MSSIAKIEIIELVHTEAIAQKHIHLDLSLWYTDFRKPIQLHISHTIMEQKIISHWTASQILSFFNWD